MNNEPIPIEVKREPGTEDVPLPRYMSEHASGMDIYAAVDAPMELAPGETKLIPTGLFIAVPPGYEAQVRPRSGLALKHGLMVVNSPGTIDSDYRGPVGIILGNLGPTRSSSSAGPASPRWSSKRSNAPSGSRARPCPIPIATTEDSATPDTEPIGSD